MVIICIGAAIATAFGLFISSRGTVKTFGTYGLALAFGISGAAASFLVAVVLGGILEMIIDQPKVNNFRLAPIYRRLDGSPVYVVTCEDKPHHCFNLAEGNWPGDHGRSSVMAKVVEDEGARPYVNITYRQAPAWLRIFAILDTDKIGYRATFHIPKGTEDRRRRH